MKAIRILSIIMYFLGAESTFAWSDNTLTMSEYCITDTRNYPLVINRADCKLPETQVVYVEPPSIESQVQDLKNRIAASDLIITEKNRQKYETESREYTESFLGKICRVQMKDNNYTANSDSNFQQSAIKRLRNGSLVGVIATNVQIVDGTGQINHNGVMMEVIEAIQNNKHPWNARRGEIIYDYQSFSIGLGRTTPGALFDCKSVK